MNSATWQVEVRTPTYRRPELLERALESLKRQTYPHWRCIVLDDEPGGSHARNICANLNDQRIIYNTNERNLGIGANIDKAFTRPPLPGSTHACVLEDDNYYLPDFIADNLAVMAAHNVDLVLRNALIESPPTPSAPAKLGPKTMYDDQYLDGVVSHEELWATLFFSTGLTNCGVFWRLDRGLCFSTVRLSSDPIFQERLRTLRINRQTYIAMIPKVVWRDNGEESHRPKSKDLFRWYLSQICAACRERELYHTLYAHLSER